MDKIQNKIISFIISTPPILALIACSYICGHIWVFLIGNVISKNFTKQEMLNNKVGKIVIGSVWVCIVTLSLFVLEQKNFNNFGNLTFVYIFQRYVIIFLSAVALLAIPIIIRVFFIKDNNHISKNLKRKGKRKK